MIRILHTIDTTGPGGAETVFVDLIKGLDRQKYEPTVVIRGPGWVCDELVKNGIIPLFINNKGSINLKYLFSIIRIIKKYKIDIIQSHLLGSNLYCSLAGMLCRVPVVSTFHGFVDIHARERFTALKSLIINFGSSRLVFVSNQLKKYYVGQKGFSQNKSITIHNGVDTSIFKPQRDNSIRREMSLGPEHILVGSVGNIRPAKGYNYLLEAARLVVNRYPQFRFAVAGQGSGKLYEDLLTLRKKLELEKHFFFLGFESDTARFLNNLDIFVLSSVSEGFSISTIEAMACGVPVIATRSGGPEEIIVHMENGILVDACNPNIISDNIISLFCDSLAKSEMIRNSYDTVRNRFTISKMITDYTEIYGLLV